MSVCVVLTPTCWFVLFPNRRVGLSHFQSDVSVCVVTEPLCQFLAFANRRVCLINHCAHLSRLSARASGTGPSWGLYWNNVLN